MLLSAQFTALTVLGCIFTYRISLPHLPNSDSKNYLGRNTKAEPRDGLSQGREKPLDLGWRTQLQTFLVGHLLHLSRRGRGVPLCKPECLPWLLLKV